MDGILVEFPVNVVQIKGVLFPKCGLMEGLRHTDAIFVALGKIRGSHDRLAHRKFINFSKFAA